MTEVALASRTTRLALAHASQPLIRMRICIPVCIPEHSHMHMDSPPPTTTPVRAHAYTDTLHAHTARARLPGSAPTCRPGRRRAVLHLLGHEPLCLGLEQVTHS